MIEYKLTIADDYILPLVTLPEKLKEELNKEIEYYNYSKLRIKLKTSKGENTFTDSIGPLIQNLCLLSIPEILLQKDYSFKFWDFHSEVFFEFNNHGEIQLTGEYCGTNFYNSKELVNVLLNCAKMSLDFFKLVCDTYPLVRQSPMISLEESINEIKDIVFKLE